MNRVIEKCLKTEVPYMGARRMFLLPYSGNLTANKITALAERFQSAIGSEYPDAPLERFVNRLQSEWFTGREKNVSIVQKDSWLTVKGENWFSSVPNDDVIVLE